MAQIKPILFCNKSKHTDLTLVHKAKASLKYQFALIN